MVCGCEVSQADGVLAVAPGEASFGGVQAAAWGVRRAITGRGGKAELLPQVSGKRRYSKINKHNNSKNNINVCLHRLAMLPSDESKLPSLPQVDAEAFTRAVPNHARMTCMELFGPGLCRTRDAAILPRVHRR